MSKVSLYINNTAVDMLEGTSVPLNFISSPATEMGSLFTNFTNSFDLPRTDFNRGVIENAGFVPSQNTYPYQQVAARLLINGRDLFGNSRVVILEAGATYRVAFYAGVSGAVVTGSIRNLDFSDANFVYNATNAAARANASPTDFGGVIWPAMNYGVDFIPRVMDIDKSYFAVYYAVILRKIFAEGGIVVSVKNQVSTLFQQMALVVTDMQQVAADAAAAGVVAEMTQNSPPAALAFDDISYDPLGYWNGITTYTVVVPQRVTMDVLYQQTTNVGFSWSGEIYVTRAGIGATTIAKVTGQGTDVMEAVRVGATVDLYAGDSLTTIFGGGSTVVFAGSQVTIVSDPTTVLEGNTIDVAASLPDISKRDFFDSLSTMANLIAHISYDGGIVLMAFERLTISEKINFSRLLDLGKEPTVLFSNSELGREMRFLYENDSFAPRETFGGARVTMGNVNLQPTVDWVTLPFSACEDITSFALSNIIHVPLWEYESTGGSGTATRVGNGSAHEIDFSVVQPRVMEVGDYIHITDVGATYYVEAVISQVRVRVRFTGNLPAFNASPWLRVTFSKRNLSPRLCYIAGDGFTGSLTYLGRTGEAAAITASCTFASLRWKNLLVSHFLFWLGAMDNYKMVRANFAMDDDDVVEFDFLKMYYVDYFGSDFYVQRINQYTGPDSLTEVELVRIGPRYDATKIIEL